MRKTNFAGPVKAVVAQRCPTVIIGAGVVTPAGLADAPERLNPFYAQQHGTRHSKRSPSRKMFSNHVPCASCQISPNPLLPPLPLYPALPSLS